MNPRTHHRRSTRPDRRNSFVRRISELIRELERAIEHSTQSSASAELSPLQQAPMCGFSLLIARLDDRLSQLGGVEPTCHPGGPLVDGVSGTEPLERLSLPRTPQVVQAVESLQAALAATDVRSLLLEGDRDASLELHLVHLFEQLLAGSGGSLRRTRGVYFTPYPLVQFIVRSIDLLLHNELRLSGGIMTDQERLRIIDPACGSGAFLLGVLQQVRERFGQQQRKGPWTDYACSDLLPNLSGIDVMPACCAAAEILVQRAVSHNSLDAAPQESGWSARCGNPLSDVELARGLFAGAFLSFWGILPMQTLDAAIAATGSCMN